MQRWRVLTRWDAYGADEVSDEVSEDVEEMIHERRAQLSKLKGELRSTRDLLEGRTRAASKPTP